VSNNDNVVDQEQIGRPSDERYTEEDAINGRNKKETEDPQFWK